MKKNYEFLWFVILQVCLVLLYIYKESTFIALFYNNQKMEKKSDELISQAKDLNHQLQELHSRLSIQKHAQEGGLKPLSLTSVRHLHADQPT